VRALLLRCDDVVIFEVGALVDPDLATVDALARLQLTARRLGRRAVLRGAPAELRDLLELAGLCDVVGVAPNRLRLRLGGQTEEGEQPGGVEEEGEPGDPPV
jgi:STAS domain